MISLIILSIMTLYTRLPFDDLVSRLHQLTMDDLSASIQGLPSKDRPSINRCSRHNTCIGLVRHIVSRVHYFECAGATNVCDIFLAYYPFVTVSHDKEDSYPSARIRPDCY